MKKRQENGTDRKNYGNSKIIKYCGFGRRTIFSTEGSFGNFNPGLKFSIPDRNFQARSKISIPEFLFLGPRWCTEKGSIENFNSRSIARNFQSRRPRSIFFNPRALSGVLPFSGARCSPPTSGGRMARLRKKQVTNLSSPRNTAKQGKRRISEGAKLLGSLGVLGKGTE